MKTILVCILLFAPVISFSQKNNIQLIIGGGPSFNGTGDMKGYNFLNEADIELRKRWFISPGLQFTSHATSTTIGYSQINYVTAGINIFTGINYLLVDKNRHRFAIGAGPVVRFQYSSVPVEAGSTLSVSGEQVIFLKYDKLHTTSIGYNVTPAYYYQCSKKISIGTKFILQNDSRGELISSALIFVSVAL